MKLSNKYSVHQAWEHHLNIQLGAIKTWFNLQQHYSTALHIEQIPKSQKHQRSFFLLKSLQTLAILLHLETQQHHTTLVTAMIICPAIPIIHPSNAPATTWEQIWTGNKFLVWSWKGKPPRTGNKLSWQPGNRGTNMASLSNCQTILKMDSEKDIWAYLGRGMA